jgi:peptide/nickel transport system ATP-binding protein
MTALLEVEDLRVSFRTADGVVGAVDGVSFSLEANRTLGIVGESGSGKSVTGLTIMGLSRGESTDISGSVRFEGDDLLAADDRRLRAVRGDDIAMVFQDPLSALHPFFTVGDQLVEAVLVHRRVGKGEARRRALELLGLVGIPAAERRMSAYPHELSGGMRQRAMIAMALINDPRLLIADEPTTALDVTVQAQILELIRELQAEREMAVILITHDLGVVGEVADEVAVMYAGRIVERAGNEAIFEAPQHPYTWGLLQSIPKMTDERADELVPIPGRPPSLIAPPSGCRFHPRCPYARPSHSRIDPRLEPVGAEPGHEVACLLPERVRRNLWARLRAGATPAEARGVAEDPVLDESEREAAP